MFVWRARDGRASVKRAEKDSPIEGLTTVFHSLLLVERLLFMTELAHFVFLALFSRLRAMNWAIPVNRCTPPRRSNLIILRGIKIAF